MRSAAPSVPFATVGPASDTAGIMQISPLIDPGKKIDYKVPMLWDLTLKTDLKQRMKTYTLMRFFGISN